MRREVADIRTRFSTVGLPEVRTAFGSMANALTGLIRSTTGYGVAAGQAAAAGTRTTTAANAAAEAARRQVLASQRAGEANIRAAQQSAQANERAARAALDAARAEARAAEIRARAIRAPRGASDAEREAIRLQRAAAREAVENARALARARADELAQTQRNSREAIAAARAEATARTRAVQDGIRAQERARAEAARNEVRRTQEAERATRDLARTEERQAREAVSGQNRVARETKATTGVVEGQESKVRKLAVAVGTVGAAAAKAALAMGKMTVGAALGAVGLGAGGFNLAKRGTENASEYAREQYNTSLSTGLDPRTFQLVAEAAKKADVDVMDLRSSLLQFQGQVRSAALNPDSDIGKIFSQMGVDLKDANGKLKTTDQLLFPVLEKLETMGSTEKVGAMMSLFGEDDTGKLLPFFKDLMNDPDLLKKTGARQQQLGTLITSGDLARARQYKQSVDDLSQAWKGVSLEIMAAVGPDVSRMISAAATDLGNNRIAIASAFRIAFQTFYGLTRDIGIMIFGGRQYDYAVVNQWMLPVRDGLVMLGTVALATGRLMKEAYFAITGQDQQVKEFPWLIPLRDGLATAFTTIKTFASDAWNVINFQDYNVSGRFPWMTTLRDGIVAFVADLKLVWADLATVWEGNGAATTGPGKMFEGMLAGFAAAKVYVAEWVTWFKALGADVAHVWEQIGNPTKDTTFNNAWMADLAKAFWFVADAAKEGWGWFKKVYETIFDFVRDTTGLNFESILFFVAFLTFTGTLRLVGPLLGGVWGIMMKIAGATGAATAVTSLGTALATMAAALPGLLVLLGSLAGYLGAKMLDKTVVGDWFRDLEWKISGRDDDPALKQMRQQGMTENMTPEERVRQQVRLGAARFEDFPQGSRAQADANQAQQDLIARTAREAAAGDPFLVFKGYVPRDYSQAENQVEAPRSPIAITVPGVGTVNATQNADEYADTLRQFRRYQGL